MKIIRSISIDIETWIEAKKLSNISGVITSLLNNYLDVNKGNKAKENLIQELEILYKKKDEIKEKIIIFKHFLDKIEKEEDEEKVKKVEEENAENKNNLPLTTKEILFFKGFNIKNLGKGDFLLPQKTAYMNDLGVEISNDELKNKIKKFKMV